MRTIRSFALTAWLSEGDASLQKRFDMFAERKRIVEEQMADLQKTLDIINYKCWYYQTALEAGTEAVHFQNGESGKLPCERD